MGALRLSVELDVSPELHIDRVLNTAGGAFEVATRIVDTGGQGVSFSEESHSGSATGNSTFNGCPARFRAVIEDLPMVSAGCDNMREEHPTQPRTEQPVPSFHS